MSEPIMEEHSSEFTGPVEKKEHPTLSDISLMTLGCAIKDKHKYSLAMLLCLPTMHIAQIKATAEYLGQPENSLCQQFLLEWKRRNYLAKDRDKIVQLERSLRDVSKEDIADVVRDCGISEIEITPEMLKVHL